MTWIKCARGGGSAPAPGHDPPTRPGREAGHGETEWQVASGRGRIYSSTRSSRAMGRVVAPAVIELDEGIRLMAPITDSDLHALRIGDEIRVDFDRVRERAEMFSFTTKAADDARRYAAAALKKTVFADIDRHARPDAILATNTSTLDIDEIAGATRVPARVVGLHFFSPAHVMKLIGIVRGPRTGLPALALSTALSRRLGKVPVVVGLCFGFVGNRLMIAREAQAQQLVLEGATPDQVDRVLTQFGLPMGTFELQDMAGGIELSWRRRQETGEANWLIDRLYEAGRCGKRVGRDYYRYEPGKPGPIVDPEVTGLIAEASRVAGIERRAGPQSSVRNREYTRRQLHSKMFSLSRAPRNAISSITGFRSS